MFDPAGDGRERDLGADRPLFGKRHVADLAEVFQRQVGTDVVRRIRRQLRDDLHLLPQAVFAAVPDVVGLRARRYDW